MYLSNVNSSFTRTSARPVPQFGDGRLGPFVWGEDANDDPPPKVIEATATEEKQGWNPLFERVKSPQSPPEPPKPELTPWQKFVKDLIDPDPDPKFSPGTRQKNWENAAGNVQRRESLRARRDKIRDEAGVPQELSPDALLRSHRSTSWERAAALDYNAYSQKHGHPPPKGDEWMEHQLEVRKAEYDENNS